MTTFFTADLHFGHAAIIGYCDRPWGSVEEMNLGLVERWNDVVGPDDTVYVLGDVVMGRVAETVPLAAQLNGRKLLVPGNHDRCFPPSTPARDRLYTDAGFKVLGEIEDYLPMGVLLCHFPYEGDSHDTDRYADARPPDDGLWLLHGHVHNAWKVRGNQINVGVDVWDYRPVARVVLEELTHEKGMR